jgi:hypothetical protein
LQRTSSNWQDEELSTGIGEQHGNDQLLMQIRGRSLATFDESLAAWAASTTV